MAPLLTTAMIIGWWLLMVVALAIFRFFLCSRASDSSGPLGNLEGYSAHSALKAKPLPILPVLLLGPLALMFAFGILGVNLLFPVHMTATLLDLWFASIAPALVLFIASGAASRIWTETDANYHTWRERRFVVVARAMGISVSSTVFRVVLQKSVLNVSLATLPWFFSELIIAEAMFNAPGIGLRIWDGAKSRMFADVVTNLSLLAILYGLCAFLGTVLHRKIGQRLEGYT